MTHMTHRDVIMYAEKKCVTDVCKRSSSENKKIKKSTILPFQLCRVQQKEPKRHRLVTRASNGAFVAPAQTQPLYSSAGHKTPI